MFCSSGITNDLICKMVTFLMSKQNGEILCRRIIEVKHGLEDICAFIVPQRLPSLKVSIQCPGLIGKNVDFCLLLLIRLRYFESIHSISAVLMVLIDPPFNVRVPNLGNTRLQRS
jgi:hypothetical protein